MGKKLTKGFVLLYSVSCKFNHVCNTLIFFPFKIKIKNNLSPLGRFQVGDTQSESQCKLREAHTPTQRMKADVVDGEWERVRVSVRKRCIRGRRWNFGNLKIFFLV